MYLLSSFINSLRVKVQLLNFTTTTRDRHRQSSDRFKKSSRQKFIEIEFKLDEVKYKARIVIPGDLEGTLN